MSSEHHQSRFVLTITRSLEFQKDTRLAQQVGNLTALMVRSIFRAPFRRPKLNMQKCIPTHLGTYRRRDSCLGKALQRLVMRTFGLGEQNALTQSMLHSTGNQLALSRSSPLIMLSGSTTHRSQSQRDPDFAVASAARTTQVSMFVMM